MTSPLASEILPRRRRVWLVLTAVLVAVGLGCLVIGTRTSRHPLPGPVASKVVDVRPPAPTVASGTTRLPVYAAPSVPVELKIPAIGLSVPLTSLGLNPNGTVEVPTDIQEPGWYKFGPTPGQDGSAVILGHVDSYKGPAVFFKLRALVAGDKVDVTLTDGITAEFTVTSVASYLKTAFPDQAVYGPHGFSALQLVTCSGVFDTHTGHYLSNIVVSTALTGLSSPAGASQTELTTTGAAATS
jgi:Sortase domain